MEHWLLLILLFPTCMAAEINLNFFQNEYVIKMDILEVSSYNKSHFKYIEAGLVWYNRTLRAVNAKFQYLYDPRNNMFVEVQLYKMMSNEYRFFPLTFKANFCMEYNKNSFGIKDMLSRSSNLDPCNLRRGLPYSINKLVVDFSRFPPHLPVGSYKLTAKFLFSSEFQCQMDFYARLIDKPVDWRKLPPIA